MKVLRLKWMEVWNAFGSPLINHVILFSQADRHLEMESEKVSERERERENIGETHSILLQVIISVNKTNWLKHLAR